MAFCSICNEQGNIRATTELRHPKDFGVRIVRDHCHITGIVRGFLCERCNSWLALFERDRLTKLIHKIWFETYKEKIIAHVKNDTGILWREKGRLKDIGIRI